mmetsp:Transcript_59135/g.121165  ORF Transcript_59135/g.121165 Transcript_59135/m.121165 type:complete len:316 (+) Transcript_59135:1829-2776(+)
MKLRFGICSTVEIDLHGSIFYCNGRYGTFHENAHKTKPCERIQNLPLISVCNPLVAKLLRQPNNFLQSAHTLTPRSPSFIHTEVSNVPPYLPPGSHLHGSRKSGGTHTVAEIHVHRELLWKHSIFMSCPICVGGVRIDKDFIASGHQRVKRDGLWAIDCVECLVADNSVLCVVSVQSKLWDVRLVCNVTFNGLFIPPRVPVLVPISAIHFRNLVGKVEPFQVTPVPVPDEPRNGIHVEIHRRVAPSEDHPSLAIIGRHEYSNVLRFFEVFTRLLVGQPLPNKVRSVHSHGSRREEHATPQRLRPVRSRHRGHLCH